MHSDDRGESGVAEEQRQAAGESICRQPVVSMRCVQNPGCIRIDPVLDLDTTRDRLKNSEWPQGLIQARQTFFLDGRFQQSASHQRFHIVCKLTSARRDHARRPAPGWIQIGVGVGKQRPRQCGFLISIGENSHFEG